MYDVILRHYNDAGDGANSRDYVIHSYKTPNDHSRKLINPNLDIEENTAGTLKFTVPPGNAGNGYPDEPYITMGTDEIIIRRTVVRSIQTLENGVLQVHIAILEGKLSAQFSASVNGTLDIDWGDNSTHYTMTGSSIATSQTTTHPYSTSGNYVLTLTPSAGTLFNFVNMATEFWRGFPETSTKDFYNNVEYTCLGELAYLSDTVQEKKTYNYNTQDAYEDYPKHYLTALIAVHNAHCGHKKQFTVGDVTVRAQDKASKAINRTAEAKFETTPSQTTFECIQNLISNCGGHLEVRWGGQHGEIRFLDYLKDYAAPGSSGVPIVQFATNLIDYTRETDLSDLITVLYPYGQTTNEVDSEGKLVKDSEGNTVRKTVDITSVNNGKPYIEYTGDSEHPQNYLAMYGRHEASVTFSNVADASNLLKLAKLYLYNQPFVYEVLSCKAVDMIYAPESTSTAPIDYLKKVKVKSIPHGTDENGREFVVTKLSLPIDTPEETIYSMSTGSRKTQQISTSVKDHDDKQKDTDDDIGDIGDTVDDIGGGGGGTETITGADGRTGWVIGRTYIAKDAATSKGSEYMPHAEHLKLWYDSSTEVSELQKPVDSGSTYTYTKRGDVQATGKVYIGGTAIYRWNPCFVAEELTTIDDPSSYAETNEYGFAHIKGSNGLPILLYYAGPNLYGTYHNTDPDYDIDWVTRLNIKNCSNYVLNMNSDPDVQTARYSHGETDSVEGSQKPTYVHHSNTYVPFPPDPTVDDGYDISGGGNFGHLFTPWVVGTMPMPQRPFYSGSSGTSSQKAIVVYAVVNFLYGFGGAAGGISTADSANSALGSVNSSNMNSSRPTGIYCGGSGQAAALYNIEDIAANFSASTSSPSFAQGAGNYNVYAWVRNISKGTKFPFSSKEVGGLFVCAKGQVLTGFEKWTRNYNAMASARGYKTYRHAPEFGTTDTPKNQLLWLNGHGTFDGTSGSLSSSFDGHATASESNSTTGIMSIRAIGYCLSGSGQITSDEVIDNLRAIYSKYGR